jgi:hypothetical protein
MQERAMLLRCFNLLNKSIHVHRVPWVWLAFQARSAAAIRCMLVAQPATRRVPPTSFVVLSVKHNAKKYVRFKEQLLKRKGRGIHPAIIAHGAQQMHACFW